MNYMVMKNSNTKCY